MVIHAEQLTIRPLEIFDAEALLELMKEASLQEMTVGFPVMPTMDIARTIIKTRENWLINGTGWQMAIEYEGVFIGLVGVNAVSKAYDRAALDYAVAEKYRGRGFASIAVKSFIPACAERFSLHRISASVFADNAPSRRVLEKCGFAFEGIARDEIKKDGIYRDVAHYGLIL